MNMRIAYLTNSYPRATDTFIRREVIGLRARGFDIRTFAVRKAGADHDVAPEILQERRNTHYILPAGSVKLIRANVSALWRQPRRYLSTLRLALRTKQPGLRGLLYQLIYFQEAVLFSSEVRRQGITHVHNHFGDNSGTVTLLLSRILGLGYSMTIHGPHIFFDPMHWALREKVGYSRFIACISHHCRSQMMLFSDQADWNRLKIIRCGVDVDRFRYADVRQDARKLIYTGRLAAEKGLPVLFESLLQLANDGYDFELTIVGDGSDRQALEQLAQRLGIGPRLVFTGYLSQQDMQRHLQESDVFILPSFAEGVPVSLMEAMACGVPVLATHVGGVVELVEPGRTGLLVPPADSAALRDAIARYLDDFELRERVSRLGRDMVAKHFNLDTQINELARLFLASAENGTCPNG